MQIRLDTSTASLPELTALIALCASLGGRLPLSFKYERLLPPGGPDDEQIEEARYAAGLTTPVDDVPAPPAAEENDQVSPDVGGASELTIATSPPVAGAAVELDADGIPWDERIHASTKTKTKADVWTKKRNVDEVLYGQIHAELQEQHAGPLDDTPPPPASSTLDESAPTDDTDVPPPPAPDASAGSETASNTASEFKEFSELVTAVAPFNIPYVKLAELAGKVTDGLVARFPDLKDKPDYWSDFYELAVQEAG